MVDPIEAVRRAIPGPILKELVDREIAARRDKYPPRDATQPALSRFSEINNGTYKRQSRPVASADDRRFVPGVLRHWRRVHGLNPREAQARIGYSARSSSWRHWESGFAAPPYRALLKIIASTGLGYWVDHDHRAGLDADLRLEADAAAMAERKRLRQERAAHTPDG